MPQSEALMLLSRYVLGLVEAPGVEPGSEKVRREKPTCVSGSLLSATALDPAKKTAA